MSNNILTNTNEKIQYHLRKYLKIEVFRENCSKISELYEKVNDVVLLIPG